MRSMVVPVTAEEFGDQAEPFRVELLAHCYRMTGSVQDAEDLVQDTYLRAWRSYDRFEHRSSLRTWLYRIATNACLNALEHRKRRVLASGLGPSSPDPVAALEAADPGTRWIEPLPDAMLAAADGDPAAIAIDRETVRLALVASLQYLSPRQRAVLILRDVLAWPAAQVAETLEMNVGAVKSRSSAPVDAWRRSGPSPATSWSPAIRRPDACSGSTWTRSNGLTPPRSSASCARTPYWR
jgi:RNA polymerase sigma-70 factor (ECF subfamily)